MNDEEPKTNSTGRNLNTILLWISLGVMSFVGILSFNNAVGLARMEGAQMSRTEVEAKLAEVKVVQTTLEKDVIQIKLDVANIDRAQKR